MKRNYPSGSNKKDAEKYIAKLPKLPNYVTTAVTGDTDNNVQSVGYAGAAAAAAAAAANVSCQVYDVDTDKVEELSSDGHFDSDDDNDDDNGGVLKTEEARPSLTSGQLRMKKKLFLDVDTGVDDAQAIMMALAAPDVEILGITCCHGNTSLENALKNTLRVLKVCNRLDIPVYRGCAEPMIANKRHAGDFHGKDGLGDVPDPDPPSPELLKKKAVQAMIKTVKENPGEVTLVATAPLTNLAVAVLLAPNFPKKLKALYIMGGNTDSRGNTTVCGEFNFVADPEAAHIVLDRYTCPTYIATWEFSCRNSLPWTFCDVWFAQDTDKARFMEKISRHTRQMAKTERYQKEVVGKSAFNTCDAYALAAAIDDDLVTESEEVAVTVELEGTYTRGMMAVDHMGLLKKKHKAVIMKKVDLERFKQMLMNALK